MTENPIIVALDGLTFEEAEEKAELLGDYVGGFKANDLLDTAAPKDVLKMLKRYGDVVMADPKFHDIPNTVKNRIAKYAAYGADLITVMAESGITAMMDANGAIKKTGSESKIVAVTVPTSIGEEECQLTYGGPVKAKVLLFARYAVLAGVEYIVCSANELEFLSKFLETKVLKKITPGTVPEWMPKPPDQDVNRVAAPSKAVLNGAKYIVIGRAVLSPPKEVGGPINAVERIINEIEKAQKAKN